MSVSVVVPVYNRESYLGAALDSFLSQAPADAEVVVVDDGSTDGTPNVARRYADRGVRYVHKEHSGAPATRNRGVAEACGEFILWLDSDDVLLPGALDAHDRARADHPDAGVLYGDLEVTDRELLPRELLRYPDFWRRGDALRAALLHGSPVPNPGTAVRRELYDRVGGFDESFPRAHDYEWWSRAAREAEFKHVGATVARWRWHDGNLSAGSVPIDKSFDARVVRRLLDRYPLRELVPDTGWERAPSPAEAVARLAVAVRLISLGDLDGSVACIEAAPSDANTPEIKSLATRLRALADGTSSDAAELPSLLEAALRSLDAL